MSASRTQAILGCTLALLLVAGCASAIPDANPTVGETDESPSPPAYEAMLTEPAVPLWSVPAQPIGDAAAVVDDVVLAYVSTPEHPIALAAYDMRDGDQLWVRASTIGQVRLRPIVVDGGSKGRLVATMDPMVTTSSGLGYSSTVHLLNPRTGETVASTPAGGLWASPFECGAVGVCMWTWRSDSTPAIAVLGGDGTVSYIEDEYFWPQGGSLYTTTRGGEDFLVRKVAGRELWRIPGSDLVGADGKVFDSYFYANTEEESGTAIYYGDGLPSGGARTAESFRTGSIDLETGEILWVQDAALPCLQGGQITILCEGDVGFDENLKVTSTAETRPARGVDSRTGKELWSGDLPGAIGTSLERPGSVPGVLVVSDENEEPLLVDAATGDVRGLADGEYLACYEPVTINAHEGGLLWDPTRDILTGAHVSACGPSGTSTDPDDFTQAVARGRMADVAEEPFNAESLEPRVWVVFTADRIAAYEF